ncbi:MAG: uroporphyrinogen-III C-methyltransferase [Thauera sp.]|nr:uroporphyrinogen-III C-methyltransferase [Thauera sp.]
MNEENAALTRSSPEAERSSTEAQAGSATPSRSMSNPPPVSPQARSGLAGWALLVALIGCGAAGWAGWQAWEMRFQSAELREELARRLGEGETIATEARGISRQQQETIAALQGKMGALEAKVEATEGQAAALEALYQAFSRTREDEVIAEVEQTIAAAAQHLQLAGNVHAALIVLQAAEQRLALHDKGQLAPLRRALAKDIETLKLMPATDIPGLGLRLERLLERADAMPLAFEGQLPAAAVADKPGSVAVEESDIVGRMKAYAGELAYDIWRELRALVRVERLDQPAPVLLAPAQSTFLRENLKIRLLTARLALLARDGRTYGADLAQARSWIERFFDLRDERVRAALDELKELEGVVLSSDVPTLTESFAALRQLQARGRESAPPVPATRPAPVPQPPGAAASVPAAPR